MKTSLTALFIALGSLVGLTNASAQTTFLTFSGGSGSEVTVSWAQPITYTLDFTSPNFPAVQPYFVFQAVANSHNIFGVEGVPLVAPTYIGSGTGSNDGLQTVTDFYGVASSNAQNAVHTDDMVFFSATDTAPTHLTAGDVIVLSAGSLTYTAPSTSASYFGVLPISGLYNTIVVDAAYANLGTGVSASAVPEPSTYAAIAGAAMLGLAAWRRRRSLA